MRKRGNPGKTLLTRLCDPDLTARKFCLMLTFNEGFAFQFLVTSLVERRELIPNASRC